MPTTLPPENGGFQRARVQDMRGCRWTSNLQPATALCVAVGAQAGGGEVFGDVVAALRAVGVGDLNAAEALAADRGHLEAALGTEVDAFGQLCGAVRAADEDGLAQQEVDDRAHASGEENDEHPERGGHRTAFETSADVADQIDIAGQSR